MGDALGPGFEEIPEDGVLVGGQVEVRDTSSERLVETVPGPAEQGREPSIDQRAGFFRDGIRFGIIRRNHAMRWQIVRVGIIRLQTPGTVLRVWISCASTNPLRTP